MEYVGVILCVSGDELKGIINEYTLKSLSRRGNVNKVRRACYSKSALYELDSFPSVYKTEIVEVLGDPREETKSSTFIAKITPDNEAFDYFNNYILEDGRRLPEDVVRQYSNEASIFNAVKMVREELITGRAKKGRRLAGFWPAVLTASDSEVIKDRFAHSLPANIRALERKFRRYVKEGYESLVSGKYCNSNTAKINEKAGKWLIARYATPINRVTIAQLHEEYNQLATSKGWSELKTAASIYNFLNKPEVKEQWWAMRYGELKYKEKFLRQHRTMLPEVRDRLWYSDGTKLNYFYLNSDGKVETCQVYEVMDVYSEKFIGFHISKTEDFEAQFNAFKMAIKTAGYKPQELRFDNQGGHKKLDNGNMLTKLAHLCISTAPYNGKSKTIESAFGRFQSQFLHKDWFFTGMNIQTKKEESKANMEFVTANKANLPTLEVVKEAYLKRREEWNNAKHHKTGLSRNETYMLSTNTDAAKVEIWDIIDLFWITTEKPSTYTASGIEIQVKKQRYAYEVYNHSGEPDNDFYQKNIDRKFFVKYDPTDMSMVKLYEKDTHGKVRFVADAQPFLKIHRARKDQFEGEAAIIKAQEIINKTKRVEAMNNIEELMEEHGLHPAQHGLTMPRIKGVNSSSDSYGKVVKKQTNAVPVDIEYNTNNLYDEM